MTDFDKDYIGQTGRALAKRINEHNKGYGSKSTKDPYYRPYFCAAYICGLEGMDKIGRESLERQWKEHIVELKRNSNRLDIMTRLQQGSRVVEDYNLNCRPEKHIRFVVTVKELAAI